MNRMRAVGRSPVALLIATLWLVPLSIGHVFAREQQPGLPPASVDIDVDSTGALRLAETASAAPAVYGAFRRFGMYDAAPRWFAQPFEGLQVDYRAFEPAATRVRVDVRASADGQRWSEWQIAVGSGDIVRFATPMRVAQYRVTLLSNSQRSPSLSAVELIPQPLTSRSALQMQRTSQVRRFAPTYRLRVTRQGMVGGRTANGHIIEPNDFFVSLPSWRSLSSRNGNEYMVRLSANGKSVVVPVYDVGPWNENDDYWNANRRKYRDLPVGWPQDHAAYYEDYNNGFAEKGYVRFPSAVDIGDGAYWALGLAGAQATVDVTFLWLGEDPGPNPQPLNARPSQRPASNATPEVVAEATPTPQPTATPLPTPTPQPTPLPPVVVDEGQPAFFEQGSNWNVTQSDCAYGGQARWTTTVSREDRISHQVVWRPTLSAGTYDVYAYIPACSDGGAKAEQALYIVQHAQGNSFLRLNQAAAVGGWLPIGRFTFAAGTQGYLQLRNLGGRDGAAIWFDAARWVPVTP